MGQNSNRWLLRLLTLAVITHSIDLKAQVITDLPDPDMDGAGFDVPALPEPPIAPTVQTVQTGWTMLEKISRRSGGDLFTIRLQKAVPLMRLEIRVDQSKVDILETTLIMQSGQRIAVRELTRTGVVQRGTTVTSENLNLRDAVTAIEVRIESHSAEATVLLSALSDHEYPRLTATRAVVTPPVQVQQPPAPPAPAPSRPAAPAAPKAPVKPSAPVRQNMTPSKGDEVLSNEKYKGVIVGRNSDGTYQIRDKDDGKIYNRRASDFVIFLDQSTDGQLKTGMKVLSDEKYFGVIVRFLSDGRLLVKDKDDGKEYIRSRSAIAIEVECDRAGRFCPGTRVISSGRYAGKVEAVYDNGLILVKDDDDRKTYVRRASDLVIPPTPKKCDSKGNNCAGTKVLSSGQYYGVIQSYVGDKVMVRDDDDGKTYERSLNAIAFETSCSSNGIYCKGKRVLSGEKYTGVVFRTFSDGTILIKDDDDGKLYPRPANSLAYEVKCSANSICEGSRVLASGQYTGKVLNVYSNKTVRMRDDDDGKVYFRSLDQIKLHKK